MVMVRHFLFAQEKRQSVSTLVMFFCALISTVALGLSESTGPNGSNVQAIPDPNIKGQDVDIALLSQGNALETHEAFQRQDAPDSVIVYDFSGAGLTRIAHDTNMAGILVSGGSSSHPNQIGIAPDAIVHSAKISPGPTTLSELFSIINSALDTLVAAPDPGCQVVVTGVELNTIEGILLPNGNSQFSMLYDYYAYEYNALFANAAGNGDAEVSIFGDAYNGITTGGLIGTSTDLYDKVGSESNPGPTRDERKKPDIVAPSKDQTVPTTGTPSWTTVGTDSGQTSFAVPHTGGVAAVLLSYAEDPNNTEPNDNQNEVIKAVIVNSAFPNILDEGGNPTVNATDPNDLSWVWNEDRGYGRIDAKRAYDILSNPGITITQSKGWAYDSIAPDQENSYLIKGFKNERLVVTLTWNRRVVWNDQSDPEDPGYDIIEYDELEAFLADLDLEIYYQDDYNNPITPKFSDIDNLEKFDLLLTKTGDYRIKVVNPFDSESANYALAFELLPPLEADFNIDYAVNDLDLIKLTQYWLNTGCEYPVPCYLYDLYDNDTIDLSDFSVFSQAWMDFDPRYYNP